MRRLPFLMLVAIAAVNGTAGAEKRGDDDRFDRPPAFQLVEASIPEIQHALKTHRINSKQLVKLYLDRIAAYEGALNGVIIINAVPTPYPATLRARWPNDGNATVSPGPRDDSIIEKISLWRTEAEPPYAHA